mmetsp:Transcript_86763/g.268616  ORF Transcript_86763/g.268616 Transcript_86763/m.268616 type:complete len:303 (-) Transcript_86763:423-1331(-)
MGVCRAHFRRPIPLEVCPGVRTLVGVDAALVAAAPAARERQPAATVNKRAIVIGVALPHDGPAGHLGVVRLLPPEGALQRILPDCAVATAPEVAATRLRNQRAGILALRPEATFAQVEVILQSRGVRQEEQGEEPEGRVAEEAQRHDHLPHAGVRHGAHATEERAAGQQGEDAVAEGPCLAVQVLHRGEKDHEDEHAGNNQGAELVQMPVAQERAEGEIGGPLPQGDDTKTHGVLGGRVVRMPEPHELRELAEVPRVRRPHDQRLQRRRVLQVDVICCNVLGQGSADGNLDAAALRLRIRVV